MVTQLKICKEAAITGGMAIINMPTRGNTSIKPEVLGIHAIVGEQDFEAHRAIMRVLTRRDKRAYFITEEHGDDSRIKERMLDRNNLHLMRNRGTYIVDELDGSSSRVAGHYEWSISVGFVNPELENSAGAVFAPRVNGGTLFYASKETGSYEITDLIRYYGSEGYRISRAGNLRESEVSNIGSLREAYVLFGPDCDLSEYQKHRELRGRMADKVRTTNTSGSCALALGLIAAGRADALVQPVQSPWDYAAGKVMVEQAGGVLLFYEMNEGRIEPMERLELRHYAPEVRMVGFVAGREWIAREILGELLRIR